MFLKCKVSTYRCLQITKFYYYIWLPSPSKMVITPWYIEIERQPVPLLDSWEHCQHLKTIKMDVNQNSPFSIVSSCYDGQRNPFFCTTLVGEGLFLEVWLPYEPMASVCLSVCLSVCWSVGLSVGWTVRIMSEKCPPQINFITNVIYTYFIIFHNFYHITLKRPP
jgi:hypothetical protein